MPNGWEIFPWPALFVIPMIVMAMLVAIRLVHSDGAMGPRCGVTTLPAPSVGPEAPLPAEDPIVVLRDRFVRGEIDLPEFKTRLEGLLPFDASESTPRQDRSITAASSRRTR